jgi:hypothetical protein
MYCDINAWTTAQLQKDLPPFFSKTMQQLTPQRILFINLSVLSEHKWELWPSFTHLNPRYFYFAGHVEANYFQHIILKYQGQYNDLKYMDPDWQ